MNKFLTKKLLICLIIIVLIILLIIGVVLFKVIDEKNNNMPKEETGEDFIETYGKDENSKIDHQAYFDVSSCIRQYLSVINLNNSNYYIYDENGNYEKMGDNQIKEDILKVLSEKFIEKNRVTADNIYNNIQTLEEPTLFIPIDISMVQDSEIKSFIVYGLVEKLDLEVIQELYAVVNIDVGSSTFSVFPLNGQYNNIESIKNVETDDEIKDEYINKFYSSTVTYETITEEYLNIYKRLAIGKPELMYDKLDKKYRESRFGSLNKFKEYVKENKAEINAINLDLYQVDDKAEYKQYIAIDKNEFFYFFNEKELFNYSVILDTHTIDLPEFIAEYNDATEQEKVAMNINKIVEALNMKDYGYVYDKFSDGFKDNYFKSQKDFEEYAKTFFKNNNKVKFNEYTKQANNTYVFNITLTDRKEESTLKLNTDILMRLGEGTDFVMTMSGIDPKIIYNGM